MAKRISKKIIDGELKDFLINLKEEDIKSSLIYDLFGEYDGVAKCNPYDIIDIPPGYYGPEKHKNKNTFTTTVGIWIFNKWMIESDLFDLFGYINKTINGEQLDIINQELSYALMEDRIGVEALKRFLMKTQLVMQFVTVLSPNYDETILTITKTIQESSKKAMDKINELRNKAKEMVDKWKNTLKDAIKEQTQKIVNHIVQYVKLTLSNLGGAFSIF